MKNKCAPGLKYDSGTCIDTTDLVNFCKKFNEYIDTKDVVSKIIKKKITITEPIDRSHLISQLKDRMKNMCGDDACIFDFFVSVLNVKSKYKHGVVKPDGPKGKTEWLSNFDIEDTMKQYEVIYPAFKFIGSVPSDCHYISGCELNKFNYKKFNEEGIRYFGVIHNLDSSGMPGSHWVAIFIDVDGNEIDFCDSAGGPPNSNIQKFIDAYMEYHRTHFNKNIKYKMNTKRYQRDNTECGVYSCNFILRRLRGQSFEEIVNGYLSFKEINSCRMAYFNQSRTDLSNYHPEC